MLRKNNENCSSRRSVGESSISGSLAGDIDDIESTIDSTMGDPGADQDLLDGFPDNIDDMVTVDATGIYGEEDNDQVNIKMNWDELSTFCNKLMLRKNLRY